MTYLEYEWQYRYTERLGLLCGTDSPTPDQKAIAIKEANEAVMKLAEPGTFKEKS